MYHDRWSISMIRLAGDSDESPHPQSSAPLASPIIHHPLVILRRLVYFYTSNSHGSPTLYLLVHNRSWHNLALNTYFSHQHCFSRENSNFKLWQNNNIATVSSCHPSSMFDLGSCFPKTCILIISSSQTEILWKRDQGWILIVFKYCGQKPTNAMLVPSNVRST